MFLKDVEHFVAMNSNCCLHGFDFCTAEVEKLVILWRTF